MTLPAEEQLREKLREVKDPEIGLDIVTLGLVYGIDVHGRTVSVRMTLTTPGCPLTGYFTRQVQATLLALEGVDDVLVDFVLDPPWTPEMIDKSMRLVIGV